ncbi:SGNH/GDSL hydrolase family protein [Streptomyces sp. NPDC002763]|uniref:SGNH/GDSL hydrolase family protein n=1 Tax=Streptomyces sp. NPDC002763 TaxID=3154427 RepID=UPI00332CB089
MNPLWLPVVAAQGLWVRSKTERMPPAAGPTEGSVGDGSGPPVRIGVLGESTAAGCGVGTHEEGFPVFLARELAARTGRTVEWQVVGENGATLRHIRHRLMAGLGEQLDVALLLAGVNDVLARRTPREWGDDLGAIVDGLAGRAQHVVVTGTPPFGSLPSPPRVLAGYLAEQAAGLDEASRRVCAEQRQATWIGSEVLLPTGPEFFARDGFHPGATGYRRWAEAVADHLAERRGDLLAPAG